MTFTINWVKIKGKKSFSEVIRSLLKKEGNFELLMIAFGTRSEKEAEELEKEIREVGEWIQSLTQA